MGKFEDGCYGSLKGIALIAKVLAGRCGMRYTRVAAGKGAIPDGSTPKDMEEPADYVMDAMISAITNPVDGECQVTVQLNSANVESGFYVTGLLLYAEDPDEGEVPFTYLVLENEPEWIRPSSSIVGKLATFDLIAAVGDVDKVSAAIDVNSLATAAVVQRMIGEHDGDAAAHPYLRQIIAESIKRAIVQLDITVPTAGWINEDGGVYLDLAVEDARQAQTPVLTVLRGSYEAARNCHLAQMCRTEDGVLRVWAKKPPEEEIACCLLLATPAPCINEGWTDGIPGPAYAVPVASETKIGGVRVRRGSGLLIDGDGNLELDVVSTEDVLKLLNTSGN